MPRAKLDGPTTLRKPPGFWKTFAWMIGMSACLAFLTVGDEGLDRVGMVFLEIILIQIGVVAVFLYGIAPLKMRKTYWMSPTPEIRPVEPDSAELPPTVAEGSRSGSEALSRLGFVDHGLFFLADSNPNVTTYVSLFGHQDSGTEAKRLDMILPAGAPIETTTHFWTKFADGTQVITHNNVRPSLMPVPPKRRGFPFPDVQDPARLLALHRRAIAEVGEFSARSPIIQEDPAPWILRTMAEEQEQLVKAGYFSFDEEAGVYRPTYRGAFVMTWKYLWPWGPIRKRIRLLRSRRLLRTWEGSAH
ncbi:hypothetical protein P12x_002850 [Tundrisphaera lichenicola]|uniref:hypothetical protein n=1 Tax=Tundrisphaera lichenicola TaxID=2029860 RepID=UPI003EBAEDD2